MIRKNKGRAVLEVPKLVLLGGSYARLHLSGQLLVITSDSVRCVVCWNVGFLTCDSIFEEARGLNGWPLGCLPHPTFVSLGPTIRTEFI